MEDVSVLSKASLGVAERGSNSFLACGHASGQRTPSTTMHAQSRYRILSYCDNCMI